MLKINSSFLTEVCFSCMICGYSFYILEHVHTLTRLSQSLNKTSPYLLASALSYKAHCSPVEFRLFICSSMNSWYSLGDVYSDTDLTILIKSSILNILILSGFYLKTHVGHFWFSQQIAHELVQYHLHKC